MYLRRARQTYLCKDRVWTDKGIAGFKDGVIRECYMLQVPTEREVKVLLIGTNSDHLQYIVGGLHIEDLHQFKDFR